MTNEEKIELCLKRLSMGKTSDVVNFSHADTLAYIERLKAENAELRARLERAVELPCKVGDTVYYLQTYCNYKGETVKHCSKKERPIMCECDEIAKRWSLPNWIYVIRERPFRLSDLSRIGKTVFLYCEEAEAKIAELRREENEKH